MSRMSSRSLRGLSQRDPSQRGFTLVELLVVIAIIGVLVALLLPAVQAAREAARRSQCLNNLRQVGLSMHTYHAAMDRFPTGVVVKDIDYAVDNQCPPKGRKLMPWSVAVLPYMEQQAIYDRLDPDKTFPSRYRNWSDKNNPESNGATMYKSAKFYKCPSNDRSTAETVHSDYMGCSGGGDGQPAADNVRTLQSPPTCAAPSDPGRVFYDNGVLFMNSEISTAQITDGTTNTYMLGETFFSRVPGDPNVGSNYPSWAAGLDTAGGGAWSAYQLMTSAVYAINTSNRDEWTNSSHIMTIFTSKHPGGCHMSMADGSGHFISDSMDVETHRALGARDDSLPTGGFAQ